MKAILIDVYNKEIKEVTLDTNKSTLQQWYDFIKTDMVEVALDLDDTNSIIVDEEGMLKPTDNFFVYDGAHQPFAGNGLIVGTDIEDGDAISCTLSIDDIKQKVKFLSRNEVINMMNHYEE